MFKVSKLVRQQFMLVVQDYWREFTDVRPEDLSHLLEITLDFYIDSKVAHCRRFLNGLWRKHHIRYDTLVNNFFWCGGNIVHTATNAKGELVYDDYPVQVFHKHFDDTKMPTASKCVCDQPLKYPHFITNAKAIPGHKEKGIILVIGQTCARNFGLLPSKKQCRNCNAPHRNRRNNYCNACRLRRKKCSVCKAFLGIDTTAKYCYAHLPKMHRCLTCNKRCLKKYKKCYSCSFLV